MYAHGYEFMGAKPRQSENPDFPKRMAPFLERGFAIAASDYRVQGYSLPEGVDDTEALRGYFVKKYGKPDSTFMVGHSLGGGVTLATVENFGKKVTTVLCRCVRCRVGRICSVAKSLICTLPSMGCFPTWSNRSPRFSTCRSPIRRRMPAKWCLAPWKSEGHLCQRFCLSGGFCETLRPESRRSAVFIVFQRKRTS